MDNPSFLDLSEAERRDWAALPASRFLLHLLGLQVQQACDESLSASATGAYPRASYHAGYADALRATLAACTDERVPADPDKQDDDFVDPARRKGRHGK